VGRTTWPHTYLHEQGVRLDAATFASIDVDNLDAAYEQARQDWIEITGHQTLRRTLADFGYAGVPEAVIDEGIRVSLAYGETLWKPFPDTFETLERLRAAGYRLGLVSNFFDDGWIQRTIDNSSLRPWFWPTLVQRGVRRAGGLVAVIRTRAIDRVTFSLYNDRESVNDHGLAQGVSV